MTDRLMIAKLPAERGRELQPKPNIRPSLSGTFGPNISDFLKFKPFVGFPYSETEQILMLLENCFYLNVKQGPQGNNLTTVSCKCNEKIDSEIHIST